VWPKLTQSYILHVYTKAHGGLVDLTPLCFIMFMESSASVN